MTKLTPEHVSSLASIAENKINAYGLTDQETGKPLNASRFNAEAALNADQQQVAKQNMR